MKVSIAMATYNGEAYLQEQLDSFRYQTRLPDEVVISDDGSIDNSVSIAQQFKSRSPFPVHVISDQPNLGYAGNFNRALRMTTGDLVFLSDQDDYWFPEKLDRMARCASQHSDTYVVMCDAALTDGALNEVGVTKLGQIEAGGLPEESFVMGCCGAVKRELLEAALPIPEGFPAHDNWLVGLADGVGRKWILRETLQYYRRHGANESSFIANSTGRITRLDVVKARIQRLISGGPGARNDIERSIQMSQQLACGAYRAAEKFSGVQADEFYALSRRLDDKTALLGKRQIIRAAPHARRFTLALTLWVQGGYRTFNGYKSMMRDIVIP